MLNAISLTFHRQSTLHVPSMERLDSERRPPSKSIPSTYTTSLQFHFLDYSEAALAPSYPPYLVGVVELPSHPASCLWSLDKKLRDRSLRLHPPQLYGRGVLQLLFYSHMRRGSWVGVRAAAAGRRSISLHWTLGLWLLRSGSLVRLVWTGGFRFPLTSYRIKGVFFQRTTFRPATS